MPLDDERFPGVRRDHFLDVALFLVAAGNQYRIQHLQRGQRLVDDPGERLDCRPPQVSLQRRCFVYRRCLGKRTQNDSGECRITQARKMVTQYPWIYERNGLFGWRLKAGVN